MDSDNEQNEQLAQIPASRVFEKIKSIDHFIFLFGTKREVKRELFDAS